MRTPKQSSPSDSPDDSLRLTRRDVFPLVGAAALAAAMAAPSVARADDDDDGGDDDEHGEDGGGGGRGGAAPNRFVYVGTYTEPHTAPGGLVPSTARGIYVFRMNGRTGRLTLLQVVDKDQFPIENPSWVTLDPSLSHLYATSEVATWRGQPNTGGLTAFTVNGDGTLSLLNDVPTEGAIPAHVIVAPDGRYAVVANYIGANFSVFPIRGDGSVATASDVFPVSGKGPNTERQEAPHPHQTVFDPAGKYWFGPDLGTDKIWSWTLVGGKLIPNPNLPYDQVASGSGPRHMTFHPSGRFVYVIDEMVSSITAFAYDQARGTFTWIQTVSTIPENFTGTTSTAEIIMHPSGRFVYGSNRGHNTIVGFRINQTTGKLRLIGWTSTQGGFPRGFNIDPSGHIMLVGNQNSDTIVPFRIDTANGHLHPTGAVTHTPVPVSIAFGRVVAP